MHSQVGQHAGKTSYDTHRPTYVHIPPNAHAARATSFSRFIQTQSDDRVHLQCTGSLIRKRTRRVNAKRSRTASGDSSLPFFLSFFGDQLLLLFVSSQTVLEELRRPSCFSAAAACCITSFAAAVVVVVCLLLLPFAPFFGGLPRSCMSVCCFAARPAAHVCISFGP